MKKIILCLLAFSLLTFMSCNKEKENTQTQQQEPANPAKAFAGDYIVNGSINISVPSALVPYVGSDTFQQPINDVALVIALNGNKGDVTLTVGEYSTAGYVNESGLHVDPIIINYPIMNTNVDLTVTVPVIAKPVNGVTSCQATVMATVQGMGITGTADVVATKKAAATNN